MARLKVLQVGSALPETGGIDKFIINLSKGLRDRDILVNITAIPNSWLWGEARALGFDVIPLTVRSQHDFRAVPDYCRLLRSGSYDIVNTHHSRDYIVPAIAARFAGEQKMVLTRHMALPWRGLKPWMYRELLYHGIIAVSDAVRNKLVRSGIPESRVDTVHGGVEMPAVAVLPAPLREDLALPAESVLIGMVARLIPEKGQTSLIAAMRYVDPRAICIIAGTGRDEARLRALANEGGLDSRIRFLGWRADSSAVIAALDILVQPSTWEEACSTAILEGMALEKPLVVTDVGGNPELVEHGVAGLLVPKNAPEALAAALNTLIDDAPLRKRMGVAAAARRERNFTIAQMAEKTERSYAKVLSAQQAVRTQGGE